MSKLLIVGSTPHDREILGLIAEFRGHTCATTGSLEEAVNLLQKGFFDLVVVEFGIIGNSPQIVRRLKSGYPDLAVIVLTTNGETIECADDTITLPCAPEILTSRIESVLGKLIGLRAKFRREKRRFARYVIELPCWVRDLHHTSELIDGRTVDISRGGVYLLTRGEWKVGTPVECLIQLSSAVFGSGAKAIRGEGRVVRIVPDDGGAVRIGATIERHEFVAVDVKEKTI